jgi:hypothetical protein
MILGAGYDARFEGGVLDGQVLNVPSLTPLRYANRRAREGAVPAPSKPVGAKYDGYELVEHEPTVYRHRPQSSSR